MRTILLRPAMLAALVLAVFASGCATVQVGEHQPSMDTVTSLREPGIGKLNVGEFALAKGVDPAIDRSISSRGAVINPPGAATFSQYLKSALTADLKAAGKFDPSSRLTVRGELTVSQLHTGISTGSATLAAHIYMLRDENVVFDKVLRQEQEWPSSFVGMVAIPDAINHYTEQYSLLLAQLYSDVSFRKACATASP